jgi:probable phosphoglycerate mutase
VRTVYVVTHPEATHHVEQIVGGWHDSDLTPAGVRATTAIAAALRSGIPDGAEVEIVSSDLTRTRRTAAEVARVFGVDPVLDRRLRKRSFGEAEGKPRVWLDGRFLAPPATGERRLDHVSSPGAEPILVRRGAGLRGHGGDRGAGQVAFRSVSGGITTLREDDRFHNREVVALGDSRHLKP